MNQTFSFPRFVQTTRWFWAANGRTYSLSLLALLTLTTLAVGRVLLFSGYDASIARNNIPYFLMLAVTASGLLGTYMMSVLHDHNSALLYLMLPASRTEKFTVAVLFIVVSIVGYSAAYVGIEALFFQVANSRLPATGNLYHSLLINAPVDQFRDFAATGYGFLLIAVVTLLGSLYFRRGVLVKNVVLTLGLLIGLTVLYSYGVGAFFPGLETHVNNRFFAGDLYVHPKGRYANAPKLVAPAFVKSIFPWLLLGALWLTTRIRFNEIER